MYALHGDSVVTSFVAALGVGVEAVSATRPVMNRSR
jgi:hypothetical protein